jgi:tryptophanyl-tRNA synthetase
MNKRILSGIQPSGKLHIGNYFGAAKQHIDLQEDNHCFYMLANLHSLTTNRDGEKLRQQTIDLALDYLALGLDPEKMSLFVQSEVPEHAELTWIFSTLIHTGLLERAHAWKDAKEKGSKDPTVGLFTYPVLMACDILLYEPDLVPVGQDQKQHIEIARDIAIKFNNTFGEIFKLPEAMIPKDVAVVPGTDGRKMSKSYGNTIQMFANEKDIKKQIMGIETDSAALEDPKDPNKCNVVALYRLIASPEETQKMEDNYRNGGYGYGHAKTALFERFMDYFKPFREKRIELENNMDYLSKVLNEGNEKARAQAQSVMQKVKDKTGLSLHI